MPHHRIHLAHSAALTLTLVQQTDMLSFSPWPLVETDSLRTGLLALPLRERFHSNRVGIVRRGNEALSHAATRFLAHFMEQMRGCIAADDRQLRQVFRSVELEAAARGGEAPGEAGVSGDV